LKKKVLIILGVIVLVSCAVGYDVYYAYKLSKDYNIVDAKIVDFEKASGARVVIEYIYEVDKIKFRKSTSVSYFKCEESNNKKVFCLGLKVKVKYYPNNPNINEVLLGKYDRFKLKGLRNSLFK
jgi:hypothetical protein